ncbi:hypothetical protein [uncultured Clostridium sp.]|nr:hypothetical protein [uncultured Clostridium sp.]
MFALDKLILDFIKNLLTDSYTQFITLLSTLIALQAIFPEKKKR